MKFAHRFVELMPPIIEEGVLYVSIEFATVVHKCACGCGLKVVTPLSPIDWKLSFDGESISLWPSIGNWSFPCQSHYFITENSIEFVPKFNKKRIAKVKKRDKKELANYFKKKHSKEEKK